MAPSKPLGGGIDDPTRNETERYMSRLLKIRNKSLHFILRFRRLQIYLNRFCSALITKIMVYQTYELRLISLIMNIFRYTYISQILEGTKECKIAAVTALVEVNSFTFLKLSITLFCS